MKQQQLQTLDDLTLDLHTNLCILISAVKCDDSDLEIYSLVDFIEEIYKQSKNVRHIFENSLL